MVWSNCCESEVKSISSAISDMIKVVYADDLVNFDFIVRVLRPQKLLDIVDRVRRNATKTSKLIKVGTNG